MAGKISELAALTGANAATTDLIETVDISDTSMAVTGTNKRMTLAEMVNFLIANGIASSSGVSGTGNVFPFLLNATTAEAGITGNQLRGNNGTFTSSTKLWIMNVTTDNLDVSVGLGRIKAGFQVYIQNYTNAAQYALFNVTADSVAKSGYYEVSVALASSQGTVPTGKIAVQSLSTAQANKLFSTTTDIRGLTPGSNGAAATNYLDASGAWSTPAGGGGGATGTKMSALTDVGTGAATADLLELVDVSDTTMAASGTNKKITFANLITFLQANGITVIADGSITTAKILDRNVTAVKQPQTAALSFKGNSTGSAADIADVSVYAAQGMLRRPVIANAATAFAPVVATHENTMVTLSNASPVVVTLPSDATSNFAIGAEIDFLWFGAGSCSFAQGSSATIVSAATNVTAPVMRIRYSAATAKKIAANTWLVAGNLQ